MAKDHGPIAKYKLHSIEGTQRMGRILFKFNLINPRTMLEVPI